MRIEAILVLIGVIALPVSCGKKQPEPASQEEYLGHWKVQHPDLGTYFMTLNPDGSGSSTRAGGEFGRWQWKADHIELEWNPKNLTFYFDSGGSAPKDEPSVPDASSSSAEKVDKVP